mmetsp:Transcript_33698/g.47012  ORF Transcript_33698/g.47012 Transcript_33698/m.47012 type:complete len:310 (+) Transcript_33698:55-984(+)
MWAGKFLALFAVAATATEWRSSLSTALTVVALTPRLLWSCEGSNSGPVTISPTTFSMADAPSNKSRGNGVADSGVTKTLLIILSVLVGIFLASFLVAIFYLLYKRRLRRRNAALDDGMGRFQSLHLSESDITKGRGSNHAAFSGRPGRSATPEDEDDARVVEMAQANAASIEGGRDENLRRPAHTLSFASRMIGALRRQRSGPTVIAPPPPHLPKGSKWWGRGSEKDNGGSHARQQRRGSSSGVLLSTIPEEDSNDFDLVLDEADVGENGEQEDPVIIIGGVGGDPPTTADDSGAIVIDGEPIRERIAS